MEQPHRRRVRFLSSLLPFCFVRARFRFTLATIAAAIGLMAWGAFVTSIDAGMAVPDWPSSFDSYDPLIRGRNGGR